MHGGLDEPRPGEGSSLVSALRVLRERWWLVVLSMLLCLGIAVALALSQTKEYTASSTLILTGSSAANVGAVVGQTGASSDPLRDQATALLLIKSSAVAANVKAALKLPDDPGTLADEMTVTSEAEANLITVAATDPIPRRARALADAFAFEYVNYRRQSDLKVLQSGIDDYYRQIATLSPAAVGQRAQLRQAISNLLTAKGSVNGGAQVVDRAGLPTTPSKPKPKRDALLGLVLGGVLGVALAFVIDLFDRRVKAVEDFEELYGIRALTTVPERHRDPVTQRDRAAALEPFRILRNGLSFLGVDREVRVVLVTSAVPGEGKSTAASGLARATALSGQRVVLVEGDLRRPTFHQQFDLGGDSRGLTTALVGGVPAPELVRSVLPGLPNLRVLPSGPVPPNSAELLRSAEMSVVLDALRQEADLVIIDAPPLLPVADGQVLLDTPQVDAVLVVSRAFRTTRDEIKRTRSILERHPNRRLALVINGLRETGAGYDYYGTADEPGTVGQLLRK